MDKKVFVIMPFSATASCTEEQWTEIYENVFKPAAEDCRYVCERAFPSTGSLIKSIVHELKESSIVLADITDKNANVFYCHPLHTLEETFHDPTYGVLISYECLNLLLNTLYIDPGVEILRKCHELRHGLKIVRHGQQISKKFITEMIDLANEVLVDVIKIRDKLSTGKYTEPEIIGKYS